MKETELWLFEVTGKHAKGSVNDGSGTTGLPTRTRPATRARRSDGREIAASPTTIPTRSNQPEAAGFSRMK